MRIAVDFDEDYPVMIAVKLDDNAKIHSHEVEVEIPSELWIAYQQAIDSVRLAEKAIARLAKEQGVPVIGAWKTFQ